MALHVSILFGKINKFNPLIWVSFQISNKFSSFLSIIWWFFHYTIKTFFFTALDFEIVLYTNFYFCLVLSCIQLRYFRHLFINALEKKKQLRNESINFFHSVLSFAAKYFKTFGRWKLCKTKNNFLCFQLFFCHLAWVRKNFCRFDGNGSVEDWSGNK